MTTIPDRVGYQLGYRLFKQSPSGNLDSLLYRGVRIFFGEVYRAECAFLDKHAYCLEDPKVIPNVKCTCGWHTFVTLDAALNYAKTWISSHKLLIAGVAVWGETIYCEQHCGARQFHRSEYMLPLTAADTGLQVTYDFQLWKRNNEHDWRYTPTIAPLNATISSLDNLERTTVHRAKELLSL